MANVISFPTLATPGPRTFLWIALYIAKLYGIGANGTKIFLSKGKATFINETANLPKRAPINPPYWMILENWALLSYTSVGILLAKAFFIYFFFLVVRNSS